MNGVRRTVAVAAISMVCLGACGDSDPTPVDAGNTGTTQVMTDDSMTDGSMTDKSDSMTDDSMTDKSDSMTDDSMTDGSATTEG